jgi:hypothetical protein
MSELEFYLLNYDKFLHWSFNHRVHISIDLYIKSLKFTFKKFLRLILF